MICLPCKGCGADLGYVMWPWGDPFLPSKPYIRDGAAWCRVCLDFVTPSVYNGSKGSSPLNEPMGFCLGRPS